MGQISIPGVPTFSEIALETRRGTPIPNTQEPGFTASERAQFGQFEKTYAGVTLKSPPFSHYNCHGLIFASRRTAIYETSAIRQCLGDDGYSNIPISSVLPGDIILYLGEAGDIEHSGLTLTAPDDSLNVPLVLSKWGKFAEVIHWAHVCPYDFSNAEYYRLTT